MGGGLGAEAVSGSWGVQSASSQLRQEASEPLTEAKGPARERFPRTLSIQSLTVPWKRCLLQRSGDWGPLPPCQVTGIPRSKMEEDPPPASAQRHAGHRVGPQEMDTDSPPASCPLGPLCQVDGFDYKHIPVAGQIFQAVGSFPLLIPFVRPTRSGAKAGPRETLRQEQRKWKDAAALSSKKQTENQGTYLGLLQGSGSPAVPSLTVRGTPIRSRRPAKPLLPLLRLCQSSWRGTGGQVLHFWNFYPGNGNKAGETDSRTAHSPAPHIRPFAPRRLGW